VAEASEGGIQVQVRVRLRGLSEATVRRISELKEEPKWMLDFHLGHDEYAFRATPFSGYIGSYRLEFVLAVETKQATQQEGERSRFLAARAKQEQLLVANSATAGQSELHATAFLTAPLDTLLCARLENICHVCSVEKIGCVVQVFLLADFYYFC
jgi:hypothetical protein